MMTGSKTRWMTPQKPPSVISVLMHACTPTRASTHIKNKRQQKPPVTANDLKFEYVIIYHQIFV